MYHPISLKQHDFQGYFQDDHLYQWDSDVVFVDFLLF